MCTPVAWGDLWAATLIWGGAGGWRRSQLSHHWSSVEFPLCCGLHSFLLLPRTTPKSAQIFFPSTVPTERFCITCKPTSGRASWGPRRWPLHKPPGAQTNLWTGLLAPQTGASVQASFPPPASAHLKNEKLQNLKRLSKPLKTLKVLF